jgi:hypothetical protein
MPPEVGGIVASGEEQLGICRPGQLFGKGLQLIRVLRGKADFQNAPAMAQAPDDVRADAGARATVSTGFMSTAMVRNFSSCAAVTVSAAMPLAFTALVPSPCGKWAARICSPPRYW